MPTPLKASSGFTLIELILVIFIITLLATVVLIIIRPAEIRRRSRDVTRLSDVGTLMQAVERYVLEYGVPPDTANVTRVSNVAVGGGDPAVAGGTGWIGVDLSPHLPTLPVDILNADPYVYRYRHDGIYYEIDATLEYHTELLGSDEGSDSSRYEKGTDLTLL